jgi:hypothetical protein
MRENRPTIKLKTDEDLHGASRWYQQVHTTVDDGPSSKTKTEPAMITTTITDHFNVKN